MFKFIVTGSSKSDVISLMLDTRNALANGLVRWDASDIRKSDDPCSVEEWELDSWIRDGEFDKVDDAIMAGEVPTGGMVVVTDGMTEPTIGFVCGNGTEWFRVELPKDVKDAIMSNFPHSNYGVDLSFDRRKSRIRWFYSAAALQEWLEEGLEATDGAERSHYDDMLVQFEMGRMVLRYWND